MTVGLTILYPQAQGRKIYPYIGGSSRVVDFYPGEDIIYPGVYISTLFLPSFLSVQILHSMSLCQQVVPLRRLVSCAATGLSRFVFYDAVYIAPLRRGGESLL